MMPELTDDEMRRYAARYGLTNMTAAHLSRMQELATKVAAVSSSIPRMPQKFDEPAGITRLPLD
jgi:hypothetical protein